MNTNTNSLDSKLTFTNHIVEKIAKAREGVLSSYVPIKTLEQIYKMHSRPHLDFCDVTYHKPQIESLFVTSSRLSYWMGQIESVQYQAALAVTGTWQGTSTDKLYEELGWESLSKRRWFRRLIQFFKIQNNLTPEYLKSPVPSLRFQLIATRSGIELPQINANRDYYQNSFYPDAISSWNNLNSTVRRTTSLSS